MLLAGLGLLALYRWRIAAVSRRAAERAAARLEERERIARLGGTLTVRGKEGGGTVVAFTVPVPM